jgi:Viral BACON domain/Putative binding domain, N-terminal
MKANYFLVYLFLLSALMSFAQNNVITPDKYITRTFLDDHGLRVAEMIVPGKPPDHFRMPAATKSRSAFTILSVPAYDWSFGCSATSAAMLAAFYDRTAYPNIYTGPTNGGVMPIDNSVWGSVIISGEVRKQCPLSATRNGVDGRVVRGHVDDYWIVYNSTATDPYITNGWTQHTYGECTGDYMGTNQSAFSNNDGSTYFYWHLDGSPLYNYTAPAGHKDGCRGIREFFESRGYTVNANYTQLIYGYNGNTLGFTFSQYMQEINAGRPVMIQVSGHTMLGFGYDQATNLVYLHDTWDYSDHTMIWGDSYSGMQHYAVTVIQLQPVSPPTLTVTPSNQAVTTSAGSTSFTVTTSVAWTASSDQSWCTVTPAGAGNGTITATYTENTAIIPRTANITVTVDGLSPVIVTVVQAGVPPTLSVTPSNRAVTPAAGNTFFTVTSNSAWTTACDQPWCIVNPSGSGNGTIIAIYSVNNTTLPRVANITVTVSGLTPVVITVSQAAPTLSVTPSDRSVTAASGTTPFTVTSNTAWTAASNQSWCTVTASGSGSGTITATYAANTTFVSRIASITVTVPGLSPVVVTVTQAEASPPELIYTIANDLQTSDRTLEFDLYLLNNRPTIPLELSMIQTGILVSSGIINGGTITPSIVLGSSELVSAEVPNSISYSTGSPNGCVKIAARSLPGCGNGTIISTTGPGTRICRVKITNSVAFSASSHANLNFCFTGTPFLITRVYQYTGTPCASALMPTNASNAYSIAANALLNGPPSLAVTPSDRVVTAPAGSTSFAVTSNAAWTASSGQPWCTVTLSGYGSGTIVANYSENTTSAPRVANVTVTASGLTPLVVTVTQGVSTKTLNLSSVLLEGLYSGDGTMFQAEEVYYDPEGYPYISPKWEDGSADHIDVELHLSSTHYDAGCDCQVSDYPTVAYAATGIPLSTAGTASTTVPADINGEYYLTIKHRNSIETTSAFPVSFSGATINYSFDTQEKAYDNNMTFILEADGVTLSPPLVFGGDVTQDQQVEAGDLNAVGNDASAFVYGYVPSDINGDGQVESLDINIAGNNASAFVYAHFPM